MDQYSAEHITDVIFEGRVSITPRLSDLQEASHFRIIPKEFSDYKEAPEAVLDQLDHSGLMAAHQPDWTGQPQEGQFGFRMPALSVVAAYQDGTVLLHDANLARYETNPYQDI